MKNKQTNKPSNSWLCSPDCAREPRGPGQALGFCTDLNCPCPGPEGSAPLSQRVTDLAPFTEETGSACLAKLRVTSGIICGVWHLLGRLSGRWKEGGPQGPRAVCGAALRAPGRPGNEGGAQTPPSGPSPSGRRGGPGACGGAAAPNGPSRATGSEGVGVHPAEGQPRWASLWARGRAPAHACARTHAHVAARTHARTRTHTCKMQAHAYTRTQTHMDTHTDEHTLTPGAQAAASAYGMRTHIHRHAPETHTQTRTRDGPSGLPQAGLEEPREGGLGGRPRPNPGL